MADCKRKTANLFSDKLIGMTWWDGVITADERFTLHIAEVKPNTTYTASGNNSVDNIMVTYYSVYPAEGQSSVESVRYVYPTNPTRSVATFTTPDDSRIKYAAVRFGSAATDVMFNLGSTAFPYESYGWVHSLRKLDTDIDIITTLPAVIHPTGTTATVGLKGQTVQSSTPSPTSPVMPNGTGERTGNLWNNLGFSAGAINTSGIHMLSNNYGTSLSTVSGGSVDITQVASGSTTAYQNGYFFIEIDISQFSLDDNIVISFDYEITNKAGSTSTTVSYVGQGATGTNVIANWSESGRAIIKATITSAMTKPYVEIRLCGNSIKVRNVQINLGSTALPYEPYGYKLTLSSANTTTPIYLGEVQTTRRVKKLVLTGEENIMLNGKNDTREMLQAYFTLPSSGTTEATNIKCSHLDTLSSGASTFNAEGIAMRANGTDMIFGFAFANIDVTVADSTAVALTKLLAYLTAQYAAGTPVTVWYVLATPETAIVNEPLMKIGDYADEVSNVSIPVTAGGDTLSVDTTVQPSEVTAMYRGWHPVQSVHEKSKNLLNEAEPPQNIYITDSIRRMGYEVEVAAGTYTAYGNNVELYAKTKINGVYGDASQINTPLTLTLASNGSIIIYSRVNGEFPEVNIMLNEGSTALPYEPYWN